MIRKTVAGLVLLLKLRSHHDMPKQVLRERGGNASIHSQPSPRMWLVSTTLRPLCPREKTWYSLCRRLDGPQGLSGRVGNSRPHRDMIPGLSSRKRVAILTDNTVARILLRRQPETGSEFVATWEYCNMTNAFLSLPCMTIGWRLVILEK